MRFAWSPRLGRCYRRLTDVFSFSAGTTTGNLPCLSLIGCSYLELFNKQSTKLNEKFSDCFTCAGH